jgi:hypothetical protein
MTCQNHYKGGMKTILMANARRRFEKTDKYKAYKKAYMKAYMKAYTQKQRRIMFSNLDAFSGITKDGMSPLDWSVEERERDNKIATITYVNHGTGERQSQVIDLATLKEKWRQEPKK